MAQGSTVVIVGGGVGGLVLATRLARQRGGPPLQVMLVDRGFAHVWKPMLHTFAAGTRQAGQQQVAFLAQAAHCGFRFVPGELAAIDRARRVVTVGEVRCPAGERLVGLRELPYDALVLATGSKANDFGTPGVAAHCRFIDDLPQAEAFNRSFYEQLMRASSEGRALRVALVGGGATGVELAAELSQWLALAAGYNRSPLRPRLQLHLLESGPRLLPAFPEAVAAAARRQLQALGVTVHTGTRVVQADGNGFVLADGTRLDADLRLWAAGVKAPHGPAAEAGLATNALGQLLVNTRLQAIDDPRVLALGDCASFTPPGQARPLPPTAQVARQQALHLAHHLPGWLAEGTLPPFRHRDLGALVSLARYNAYGTLGRRGLLRGGFVQGLLPRLAHALLYRLHQAELHGLARASALWLSEAAAALARPALRMTP